MVQHAIFCLYSDYGRLHSSVPAAPRGTLDVSHGKLVIDLVLKSILHT